MQFGRVTDFVRLKEKEYFLNYAIIRGMEDGKRLHKAISKLYTKSGNVEKPEAIFFYSLSGKKITGCLTGTPDMWKVRGKTLYVVDHKSINHTYSINNINKTIYGNQVFLYAVMILINHRFKVNKVVLELGGYHKKMTIKESMPIIKKFKRGFEALPFLKDIIGGMNTQLGTKGGVASSLRGYIKN